MTLCQLAVGSFGQYDVAGAQGFVIANDAADPAIFAIQRLNRRAGNTLDAFGLGLAHKPRIEAGAQQAPGVAAGLKAGVCRCAVDGQQGQTFLGDTPFKRCGLLKIRKKFAKRVAIQTPAGEIFTAGKFAAFKQEDRKTCPHTP